MKESDSVWISAAAGGVGTCAVQIAQRLGARVIASAGSEERCRYRREVLGIEHVIDRRTGLAAGLAAMAPEA